MATTETGASAQIRPLPEPNTAGAATTKPQEQEQSATETAGQGNQDRPPTQTALNATTPQPLTDTAETTGKNKVQPCLLTTSHTLPPASLPPHADLANESSAVNPASLALSYLDMGMHFVSSTLQTFRTDAKPKTVSPGSQTVHISRGKLNGETWVARTSKHKDEASKTSATYQEFKRGLKDDHSKNEAEYTGLADCVQVSQWQIGPGAVDGWTDVTLEVYEQVHKLPPPLQKRAFAVLVVTGSFSSIPSTSTSKPSPHQFIVVQVPVDLSNVPGNLYSNGKKAKNVTLGRYTSVESVQKKEEEIEWVMATASDARGALAPVRGLQNLGIPDAIAKDVRLFLEWTVKKRG